MTTKDKKLVSEFQEFLTAPEVTPPIALRQSITSHVHQQLNPSNQNVFFKMLGVHTVVSLFSLSICSQFGIQTLKIYDAMNLMMAAVGHTYCMALCGLLYFSVSALVLSLLLTPEDLKVIRRHQFLQLVLLTGVSLGVFLCLGAKILLLPALFWASGSILGGVATLNIGWKFRSQFRRQLIFGN